MNKKYDLIVIGGGILGTFHAYHALQKGLKVALIEKDAQPLGATVRNFGQVVPSGMDSKWQNYGRESLKIYNHIQNKFDISVRNNGSVYLASNHEEVQLIEELSIINKNNGYESHLLTKAQCLEKYTGLKTDYIKAGLFFPQEITIEPNLMINKLLDYLTTEKELDYLPNTKVIHCDIWDDEVEVETSKGEILKSSKAIVCCGSEFKTLYPTVFAESDLQVTKLQMLQTKPQPNYKLNGSILTGLSIRRYEAFYECPSFKMIKAKEDPNSFEKKWGVHILFKQATDGSIILGDSHEYADAKDIDNLGFDLRNEVDDFMINEAKKIFDLPTYEIQKRWFGIYSQSKENDIFNHTIDQHIHIITGIGGKGMTGSAGFAKENINKIFNFY
ncbi:FAD dependent oxidoreductase TIGR03364 [Chishuiella changwenlii]|uniref:FAD dependent oxidoreductase TIGR03364 n=1 Tax=Chishuiella changwenlii TaxID=1434701 RepID=A0A1M6YC82_9FLAO|nr:TIGR03364 family FAD-dependent oxidoreductase [Chishuiella changwenlii]GGE97722.1 oxidase [Chishuiella changwenlii]SHL15884.1 FAD dependent oxidoreductase TIGR03364 [Chishuiella changwenlii]